MDDLETFLAQKQYHYGLFGYKATVCGGISIVHILKSSYTGNTIHRIRATWNGTTNCMLGRIEEQILTTATIGIAIEDNLFDDALREAQAIGLTAADSYDDMQQICILSKLAFGVTVPPTIPCIGISSLTRVDFDYAHLMGMRIKLLSTAERLHEAREWDGPLCVYVGPAMIPISHLLANIRSKTNAVAVSSAKLGTCSYIGPGAGHFPAANSVVADMMRLAKGQQAVPTFTLSNNQQNNSNHTSKTALELDHNYSSQFYVRIPFSDGLGIIKRVGELAEQADVSIHSILQNPILDRKSADSVVTTEEAHVSQVKKLCNMINQEVDFCRAPCTFMPMLVMEQDPLYD